MGGKTSKRVQERFCELPEDSSFRSAGCSWLPVDSPTELSQFFRIRPCNSKFTDTWNQWREEHTDIEPDLSEANLTGVNLRKANLSEAFLGGADLIEADLSRAILVETDLTRANLIQCSIYSISVWNVQLEGAKQDSLVITPYNEPTITVDNLEVAQFIYLLLNHKKLRDVFNAVTERGVLLLGRFSGGGLEVLQTIAAKLREEKYLPIIFDFERPQDRNYTETIKTLAGLSRFVIADLSGPSVPQELYATVPHFKIPFVPNHRSRQKAILYGH